MEDVVLGFFDRITTIDFSFVLTLFGIALGAFWIVVLYWVWLDSGDRTTNKTTRIAYVFLVLFLFVVGLIIYLLIRPSQTIEEIYWADLERRYLKYETAELGDCPKCGTQLYPGFTFCPNCRYVLKMKCSNCELEMDKQYKYCPSCGNQMLGRTEPVEEEHPTKEVMEEQIQASKEEAADVVEAKRVRYTERKGVAVAIGDMVRNLHNKIFGKKEKVEDIKENQGENSEEKNQVSKKKKKKKRRR